MAGLDPTLASWALRARGGDQQRASLIEADRVTQREEDGRRDLLRAPLGATTEV